MNSLLRRSIQVVLILFIACVIGAVLLAAYPPLAVVGILATGRGPALCSFTESLAAFGHYVHEVEAFAKRPPINVLQTEGRIQQVESELGPLWEPKSEGTVVIPQLVEYAAKYEDFGGSPVRPGDVVIDCGANVGTMSRLALKSGAKLVIAIEPSPSNIPVLRRNLAEATAAGRAVVIAKGAWDKEGKMTMNVSSATSAMDSLVLARDGKGVEVPLTTIDKIVADLGLDRVDFIKIDTEGAERHILAGAKETLRRWKPRLEISFHLPDDPEKIVQAIRAARPDYRSRCLVCTAEWSRWRMIEDVVFFE